MSDHQGAPVILRYEQTTDRNAFLATFGEAFEILTCRTDEQARLCLDRESATPPALVMIHPHINLILGSDLLNAASRAGSFRILISEQMALDDIIRLLDDRVIDRCYSKPWDDNRLRADLFTATMAVDARDWPTLCGDQQGQPLVLIVDDETAATKYLSKQLLHLQDRFGVRCAASADQALEILRQEGEQVAVIMTDQRMPGMKGVQLINELRQSYPYITRILTSAYGELDVALGAVNQGRIYGYEKKPWNVKNLLPVLDDAIAQHFRLKSAGASLSSEAASDFQTRLEKRRANLLNALSEPAPNALAPPDVIGRFLATLDSISTLPPGKAHRRASEMPELEQTLIRGLRVEVATFLVPDQGTQKISGQVVPSGMGKALDTLLGASGQTRHSLNANKTHGTLTIKSDPDMRLQMYSHLLSPLTGVSNPLLEQQGALLALFIWADRLGGHLNVNGGKQTFDLTLTLPGHSAETESGGQRS